MRRTWMCLMSAAILAAGCRGGKGGAGSPGPDGTPGPTATPLAGAPRADRLTPSIGSRRSVVFVEGTSFSAVLAENEVRFAGLAGDVLAASATELQVRPPIGLAFGDAPVTVTVHQQTTAALAFQYAPSGTAVPGLSSSMVDPGLGVELSDRRVLIPDAQTGSILAIATNGATTLLVQDAELLGVRRLVESPSGRIFAFATLSDGIFSVDPADGALFVEHWGTAYRSGSFDSNGVLYAIPAGADQLDKFNADGSAGASVSLPPGSAPVDVQVIGTTQYVAINGAAPGVLAVSGGVVSPLTSTGITEMHCLSSDGVALLAGGVFTIAGAQEGVVRIDNAGTITAVTADPAGESRYARVQGVIKLQSGDLLVSDGVASSVSVLSGATLTVKAAGAARAHTTIRNGANDGTLSAIYNGAFVPGFVVETFDDGATNVRAQGIFGGMIAGDDATHVAVVRRDVVDVASIDLATGVAIPVFSVAAQTSAPLGLARDAGGSYYVSSPSTDRISKYDGNGAIIAADFPAATITAPEALLADGTILYVTQPSLGEARKIVLSTGAVNDWLQASVGVGEPTSIFHDPDDSNLRLYVADRAAGRLWLIDAGGFVSPFGVSVSGARAVAQKADGTLVVTGDFGQQFLTP